MRLLVCLIIFLLSFVATSMAQDVASDKSAPSTTDKAIEVIVKTKENIDKIEQNKANQEKAWKDYDKAMGKTK